MSDQEGREASAGARYFVPLRFLAAVAILFASFSFAAQLSFAQCPSASGIAQRRTAHLRDGINLSEWFAQVKGGRPMADEVTLKALGLRMPAASH